MAATDRPDDLTPQSLERLLARLGSGVPDTAGREYQAIHQKLVDFFDRRGVLVPDELADETLDRVARKIDEGEVVERLRPYCYGVGRRILLEWQKRQAKEVAVFRALRAIQAARDPAAVIEARVSCLARCLKELPPASRELIVGYYEGEGKAHLASRKVLAEKTGVTYATLKTRAYRIRAQLEECLHRCLENLGDL